MTADTYRNDLNAAQLRSRALEADLRAAQARIEHLETGTGKSVVSLVSLKRLMTRGAREEKRASERARRERAKEAVSKARHQRFARKWRLWTAGCIQRRSMFVIPVFGRWMLSLIVLGMALPFAALFLLLSPARMALAYIMLGLGGTYAVASVWGFYAVARERNRVGSLPFPVAGHFKALESSDLRKPLIRINFIGNAPSHQEAKALLLGLAKDSKNPFTAFSLRHSAPTRTKDSLSFRCDHIEHSWHADNRAYLLWYRQLIEKGAVALHDAYPVRSICIGK